MGCGSSTPVGPANAPADSTAASPSSSSASATPSHPQGARAAEKSSDRLSRFEKGAEIGRGGFGIVYSVVDRSTQQAAALKVISKIKFAGEDERQNMLTEVELMRRCKGHPSVVELIDSWEDKANFFLVLERCTGGELMDAILGAEHFSEASASRYFRQLAAALDHCHRQGVVHRDLKPENFLLADASPDAPLKITDFGLACAVAEPDAIITDACGSAFYIAPEVFSKRYTRAADVWSLGVVLYLLLSGSVPFGGESESEGDIYRAIQKDALVFGPAFASVSVAARELLAGLLEKDPAKRYTLAQAMAHPWVVGTAAPDVKLDKAAVAALGSFNARNRFKRAAIKMVASTLTAADMASLREQFNIIDADATGFITYKEMADALRTHMGVVDEKKVGELLHNIDENGDGRLSYAEWLQAMLETRMLSHQTAVWAAFNAFDLDGDGAISADEVCAVLKGMTQEEARAYVAEYDTDGDGVIKYDEFLKMMLGKNLRVKINAV